jgi:hypothetical protein
MIDNRARSHISRFSFITFGRVVFISVTEAVNIFNWVFIFAKSENHFDSLFTIHFTHTAFTANSSDSLENQYFTSFNILFSLVFSKNIGFQF